MNYHSIDYAKALQSVLMEEKMKPSAAIQRLKQLLVKNHRARLFKSIIKNLVFLAENERPLLTLETAYPLSPNIKNLIETIISEITNQKIFRTHEVIDKNIIGGLRGYTHAYQFDWTTTKLLDQIKGFR